MRALARRFVVPGLLVVSGGGVVAVVSSLDRGPGVEAIEVDGSVPEIDRPTLTGERVTPGTYRGKVLLVNFWASWCGPCRREQPGLERLWRELKNEEVQFLGINFKDDRAAAVEYLKEFDVTYSSVEDRDGLLAHRFGIPYLPATVLVDARGEMRYRLVGAQTETTLSRYLEELLTG